MQPTNFIGAIKLLLYISTLKSLQGSYSRIIMGPKSLTLLVVLCNTVYIQCFPHHLHPHNDAGVEDDLSDVRYVNDNFAIEDAVDDNVYGFRDPVALRATGLSGVVTSLGQIANGVADAFGQGALAVIGDSRDPPQVIIHQQPANPVVVQGNPVYLPGQVQVLPGQVQVQGPYVPGQVQGRFVPGCNTCGIIG
ncbi:uncharacterized protein LOC114324901 [Diabrotica virgifera virgifera]|uniref:Uncharacterized protein LOC114324901 n=1 Tax=Diabrotica virgifera virgifera TaxID=50390 RepID=A0A6P7F442_DIAVI|nr:uncharacterized protein LOC114324901 [Diabrotica virgifera virgifera]